MNPDNPMPKAVKQVVKDLLSTAKQLEIDHISRAGKMVQCPQCKHWLPDGWYIGREDAPNGEASNGTPKT